MMNISRGVSGHRKARDGVGTLDGGDVFLFCGTIDIPVGTGVPVGVGVADDIRELGTGVGVADIIVVETEDTGDADGAVDVDAMRTTPESISRFSSSAALWRKTYSVSAGRIRSHSSLAVSPRTARAGETRAYLVFARRRRIRRSFSSLFFAAAIFAKRDLLAVTSSNHFCCLICFCSSDSGIMTGAVDFGAGMETERRLVVAVAEVAEAGAVRAASVGVDVAGVGPGGEAAAACMV